MPDAAAGSIDSVDDARRPNVLFILSDEHDPAASGPYGHPRVRTPHLDRLAREGTVFERAYCTSPMCVPSRLSLLSGRYRHQIGAWDNEVVMPSSYRSWGHHMRAAGYETVLAGRTHFNGADRLLGFDHRLSDDLGFWYHEGDRAPNRSPGWRRGSNSHASECGPGDHPHTRHDDDVTDRCAAFLEDAAARRDAGDARPWLLYCGFMHPHFPLLAPPEYLALYPPESVPLPHAWDEPVETQHPVIRHLRWSFRNEAPLPEQTLRLAVASYWALVTLLDERIGRLLDALDRTGLAENTVVVYASDHGEMAGQHGIWQKQCFYESSVRVPLQMRIPATVASRLPAPLPARVTADVSLMDALPTLRQLAGLPTIDDLPGRSLLAVANDERRGDLSERPMFAEYHSQGMLRGGFMLKRGRWKYCHYVGERPQLFDMTDDPYEDNDLAGDPRHAQLVADLDATLRSVCDPAAVDEAARADQAQRRAR